MDLRKVHVGKMIGFSAARQALFSGKYPTHGAEMYESGICRVQAVGRLDLCDSQEPIEEMDALRLTIGTSAQVS